MNEPGYAQARFTRYIVQAKRRETWRMLLVFLLCLVAGLIAVTAVGSLLGCLLYTSPSPRDRTRSRMPSSA